MQPYNVKYFKSYYKLNSIIGSLVFIKSILLT